jgi:hypothetical protein
MIFVWHITSHKQGNEMPTQPRSFDDDAQTATIRVVEGWIGNWRISLRRRDTRREQQAARAHTFNQLGE